MLSSINRWLIISNTIQATSLSLGLAIMFMHQYKHHVGRHVHAPCLCISFSVIAVSNVPARIFAFKAGELFHWLAPWCMHWFFGVCVCIRVPVWLRVCMCVCVSVSGYMCVCVCTWVCMRAHVHLSAHLCAAACGCVYVCVQEIAWKSSPDAPSQRFRKSAVFANLVGIPAGSYDFLHIMFARSSVLSSGHLPWVFFASVFASFSCLLLSCFVPPPPPPPAISIISHFPVSSLISTCFSFSHSLFLLAENCRTTKFQNLEFIITEQLLQTFAIWLSCESLCDIPSPPTSLALSFSLSLSPSLSISLHLSLSPSLSLRSKVQALKIGRGLLISTMLWRQVVKNIII